MSWSIQPSTALPCLVRPAKLASTQGEFVCVLRDISRTGFSAKLFHKLPSCEEFTLELQNGQTYAMCKVDLYRFRAGHLSHYATLASNASGLMPPRYEWRLRVL